MRLIESRVQLRVEGGLPGQILAWSKLWSKLLAPVETENSVAVDGAATGPENSGIASASRAEQTIMEA